MGDEIVSNSISAWLKKQLKISVDRRQGFERRVFKRRSGLDRRILDIEVSVERRKCNDRRTYK